MCELLGLNFNQPVRCSLSFRGFRKRGVDNPHGWGVARYEGRACQIFKEPVKAPSSTLASFLRDYEPFTSKIFIGHVRRANCGDPELRNTHPFSRTFRRRDVVFAHNGTVREELAPGPLRFHRVGETDSELLLCALLTRLSTEPKVEFADYARIEAVLREFNTFGDMNLLFSDSERLFAYRDQNGYNGLCITRRAAPFERVSLQDDDWEVDLAEEKRPDQRGYVIASHSLTNEEWVSISPGSLVVFRDGDCVYGA